MKLYSIELFFDYPSATRITAGWRQLAVVSGSDYMLTNGVFPHVALTVFAGATDGEIIQLAQQVHPLLEPVTLECDGVRGFGDKVVYLGVRKTDNLLMWQREVCRIVAVGGGVIDPHYRPENWVPHCTLAMNVMSARFADTLSAARTVEWPALVVESTGVVSFPPTVRLWHAPLPATNC